MATHPLLLRPLQQAEPEPNPMYLQNCHALQPLPMQGVMDLAHALEQWRTCSRLSFVVIDHGAPATKSVLQFCCGFCRCLQFDSEALPVSLWFGLRCTGLSDSLGGFAF